MRWWTLGRSFRPLACVFSSTRSHRLHLCKDQAVGEIWSANCQNLDTKMHPPYLPTMSLCKDYKIGLLLHPVSFTECDEFPRVECLDNRLNRIRRLRVAMRLGSVKNRYR